ncbi:MAG: hypothetical protein UY16_C0007G0004 [Candidatus Gottesmanbacteria bacterium GW2011_GWA2_47_9]|uniref:Uncharacterized protein n=1 Tax=Candidatus Gottesmanbacteria bacterium GW2011_GWA2_47_9 TaxID=1618445 RepID=A0A0G1WDL1_9BACT|nr:MAG: hypothetical protein UY16_C0007G0004 [Candidatus Gottesmanbacteria bacterium GW2011_GWA2_47_9]
MEICDEIPIEIPDNKLYTLIALVIDRPEIHTELKHLRSAWLKYPGEKDFLTAVYANTAQYQLFSSAVEKLIKNHHLPLLYQDILLQVVWFWRVDMVRSDLKNLFSKSSPRRSLLITSGRKLLAIPLKTIQPRFIRIRGDIRTHRRWYWMWKKRGGRDYEGLLSEWNDACPDPDDLQKHSGEHSMCPHCCFDTGIIEQAVSRYNRTLLASLTRN